MKNKGCWLKIEANQVKDDVIVKHGIFKVQSSNYITTTIVLKFVF